MLLRLFDEEAPFFLADPTEISRKQARKTAYVGKLSDGKTLGFFLLTVAQPYKGRAIPFAFITSSEGTLNREATSRNLEHQRAFRRVRELIGEKPLVLDREFSSERLFQAMVEEGDKLCGEAQYGQPSHHNRCGREQALLVPETWGEGIQEGRLLQGEGARQPGWGMA